MHFRWSWRFTFQPKQGLDHSGEFTGVVSFRLCANPSRVSCVDANRSKQFHLWGGRSRRLLPNSHPPARVRSHLRDRTRPISEEQPPVLAKTNGLWQNGHWPTSTVVNVLPLSRVHCRNEPANPLPCGLERARRTLEWRERYWVAVSNTRFNFWDSMSGLPVVNLKSLFGRQPGTRQCLVHDVVPSTGGFLRQTKPVHGRNTKFGKQPLNPERESVLPGPAFFVTFGPSKNSDFWQSGTVHSRHVPQPP